MDIKSYIAILKGNIWVIISTVIVTVAVVTLISFMTTPTYTATTTLRIATASTGVVGYSDYMYADRLMNTYIKLATSGPVLEELTKKLGIKTLPPIKVEMLPNTELIRISVESSDPFTAQIAANSLAEILVDQGKDLYSGGGKSAQEILEEQVKQAEEELNQARQAYSAYVSQPDKDPARTEAMNSAIQLKEKTYATLLEQYDQARLREIVRANIISIVDPAEQPTSPSKPNKVLNIGLGLIVGLAGGVGLAFLFENLGNRLYTSSQIIAVADLNLLGKIPTLQRKRFFNKKKYYDEKMNAPFIEAFRRLNLYIMAQNSNRPEGDGLKTIMITSSEPGEGKSTITSNLALAIAQSGKKVIVVDCDLHIPKQHIINELDNSEGLSTVLSQKIEFEKAVQTTGHPCMDVLTSGPIRNNSLNPLATQQMRSLIQYMKQRYDIVLIDTPALLVLSDAAILAPLVDGVVFVSRRNYIKEEAVREARKQLADLKANTIGLIVNDAEPNGSYYYYHRQ